jgi:hypothetical protein
MLLVQSPPKYVLYLYVNEIRVHIIQDLERSVCFQGHGVHLNLALEPGVCFRSHGVHFNLALEPGVCFRSHGARFNLTPERGVCFQGHGVRFNIALEPGVFSFQIISACCCFSMVLEDKNDNCVS